MEQEKKMVDGFRFLPPGLKAWVRTFIPEEDFNGYIPWTPLSKPLSSNDLFPRDQRRDQPENRSPV